MKLLYLDVQNVLLLASVVNFEVKGVLFEISVVQRILGSNSVIWVFSEHSQNKVLGVLSLKAKIAIICVGHLIFDSVEQLVSIYELKRQVPIANQCVENDSCSPNVDFFTIAFLKQYLGCHVCRSSAALCKLLTRYNNLRQPKIGQLNLKDLLRFLVSDY